MSSQRSSNSPAATASCLPSSSVDHSIDPNPDLLFPVTRTSVLNRRVLRIRTCSSPVTRRKREMIPAEKKDAAYWDKRHKNNEAAKRSREKKRLQDMMLEGQLLALSDENAQLRAQVLSLHYHSSLRAEKSYPSCHTSAVGSTSPLSPTPPYTSALFWGNSRSNPVSLAHPFEAKIPRFTSHNNDAHSFSPLSGPCYVPPSAVLETKGEMDAQRQVSSSDDIPSSTDPASSIQTFLPAPETFPRAAIVSYPPQAWLLPGADPSVTCNDLLLPWRSPLLALRGLYPGLPPLCAHGGSGLGPGVEANLHGAFRSRFSSAPAGVDPLGL